MEPGLFQTRKRSVIFCSSSDLNSHPIPLLFNHVQQVALITFADIQSAFMLAKINYFFRLSSFNPRFLYMRGFFALVNNDWNPAHVLYSFYKLTRGGRGAQSTKGSKVKVSCVEKSIKG